MEDIDLINYIINQEKTGKEAAEYFGVSLSTVRKRLATIKSELPFESNIYQQLKEVAEKNETQGKIKGGQTQNSGPKRMLSIEYIYNIVVDMLANNLTIEETAVKYSIPRSTLADNLELLNSRGYTEIYNDLQSLFGAHKLKKSTAKIQAKYLEKLELLKEKKQK